MRVLLVANINSSHTRKWALALRKNNIEVGVFSLNPLSGPADWLAELQAVFYPPRKYSLLYRYYFLFIELKKHIRAFRPDVLHSHFLTNYSFLCCLSGFHPHVATAWGSDVYVFPNEGAWARRMLRYNLRHADVVISTSKAMKDEMLKHVRREYKVIPFGIDLALFRQVEKQRSGQNRTIRISCFKKVEPIYRTDMLIRSFSLLVQRSPHRQFELVIAGDGSQLTAMKLLAKELHITDKVIFTGWMGQEEVHRLLLESDVCVYLSANESFGVSLLEAMACGVPLVVTRTPGFLEVAGDNKALFVDFDDPSDTAEKMEKVLADESLRASLIKNGREHVHKYYDLQNNIAEQIRVYCEAVDSSKNNAWAK